MQMDAERITDFGIVGAGRWLYCAVVVASVVEDAPSSLAALAEGSMMTRSEAIPRLKRPRSAH